LRGRNQKTHLEPSRRWVF